jgi:hypothetical protein
LPAAGRTAGNFVPGPFVQHAQQVHQVVDPDQVRGAQWAGAVPETVDEQGVNRLHARRARLHDPRGVVDHGMEDLPGHEASGVLYDGRRATEPTEQSHDRRHRASSGAWTAYDLDRADQVRRVHEVRASQVASTRHRISQLVDRDGRGVRDEWGSRSHGRRPFGQHRCLELRALRDGFNHDVTIACGARVACCSELAVRWPIRRRAHRARQPELVRNAGPSERQTLFADVDQQHRQPPDQGECRNSGAHHTRAHHRERRAAAILCHRTSVLINVLVNRPAWPATVGRQ